jgi:hypothetical protein
LFGEISEMRYLWSESISLDGSRLEALLGGALPRTSLDVAVRDMLAGLGCLNGSPQDAGSNDAGYHTGHQGASRSAT